MAHGVDLLKADALVQAVSDGSQTEAGASLLGTVTMSSLPSYLRHLTLQYRLLDFLLMDHLLKVGGVLRQLGYHLFLIAILID